MKGTFVGLGCLLIGRRWLRRPRARMQTGGLANWSRLGVVPRGVPVQWQLKLKTNRGELHVSNALER
jgi:hypothetical protein